MKKFALILALLLLVPAACATDLPIGGGIKGTPAPEAAPGAALSDPAARYERFVDPDDPAADWLLRMLDSANDEPALAVDGAAYLRDDYSVGADGAETWNLSALLYETDYGYVIQLASAEFVDDMSVYLFAHRTVLVQDDAVVMTGESGYLDNPQGLTPERFMNFYDPAEKLLAVREEGEGFAYYTDSGEGMYFEYVTDAMLRFTELRVYEPEAAGDLRLTQYSRIALTRASLPQAVIDALAQGGAQ